MIYLVIALLIVSYIATFPVILRVSQQLNNVLGKLTMREALRITLGYVCSIAYLVLLTIYTIHIDHPILIVVLVLPTLIGYLIQGFEKMAGKELHTEIVSTKKESSF